MENLKNKTYGLLRWSEQYTKTDMVYLAKGGFWLTGGQVISSISSLLLAVAFANLLPAETFGTYKYVLSLMGILLIPSLPGINTAVNMASARNLDGTLSLAVKTKIQWGLLSSLASLLLSGYYLLNGNTELTISFLIASVFLPFIDSFGIYTPFLNGKKKFLTLTKYGSITHIISTLLLIITIYLTKDLLIIVGVYFSSWTIIRYIFFKITEKKFVVSKDIDVEAISYGKHLSLMKIINTVANYIDRLFVFHFLGAVPLAIYSFAIAMPEQIKGILGLLDTLAFPKFVIRKTKDIKVSLKKRGLILFILGVIVIGIYIILAPFIFKMFFPQYQESVFYSQLFSLSMINLALFPSTTALRAKKDVKRLYISNFITPVFQIITMLVLILWQGILGLIVARIISRLFGSILDTYLFYTSTKESNGEESLESVYPE